jgi:hypothetical protein
MEHRWNETDRGKPKHSGKKTYPSATLCTTNPTWTEPESNPGLRGGRPATNRLSHGTALSITYKLSYLLFTNYPTYHLEITLPITQQLNQQMQFNF